MDTPRKIGIAIVMIVPTFVFAGAIWSVFHSWASIFIWVVLMAGFTAGLIRKVFSGRKTRGTRPGSDQLSANAAH